MWQTQCQRPGRPCCLWRLPGPPGASSLSTASPAPRKLQKRPCRPWGAGNGWKVGFWGNWDVHCFTCLVIFREDFLDGSYLWPWFFRQECEMGIWMKVIHIKNGSQGSLRNTDWKFSSRIGDEGNWQNSKLTAMLQYGCKNPKRKKLRHVSLFLITLQNVYFVLRVFYSLVFWGTEIEKCRKLLPQIRGSPCFSSSETSTVVDMWLKSQCKDAKIVVNWGHRYVMCIMVTCKWYIYINKHIYIYVYIYIKHPQ